jgi:flagellar protein FliS
MRHERAGADSAGDIGSIRASEIADVIWPAISPSPPPPRELLMNNQAAQNYLRAKVLTATPEQLQLMLYDGAIRFAEQAKVALAKKDYEASYTAISRAQKIITELSGSLKHDVAPELCTKLAGLYNFVYRKLLDANVGHEIAPVDEALDILRYQRETWSLLLNQLGQQKAANAARTIDMPAPDARMEASISMQG